jgi:hypothetical protein
MRLAGSRARYCQLTQRTDPAVQELGRLRAGMLPIVLGNLKTLIEQR